jgi:hypothetical protein
LLKKAEVLIFLLLIAVLTTGCTAPLVVNNKPPDQKPPKEKVLLTLPSSETDLFREALGYLNNPEGAPDYGAVKARLESFVLQYPKSKWTSCAQSLLQTINKIMALQNKVKADRLALERANADKSRLFKEIEMLKIEAVKLQHENDQLKNDIVLLKQLEIQLEKREKMLK